MPPRDVVWVEDIRIPGLTRERQGEIVSRLQEVGIQARHSFYPLSMQEEYREGRCLPTPNAIKASEEVLYLPCSPGTVTEEIAMVAFEVIRGCFSP